MLIVWSICLNSSVRIRKYIFIHAQQVSHESSHLICTVTWHVQLDVCHFIYRRSVYVKNVFCWVQRVHLQYICKVHKCHVKNSCQKVCKGIFCQECPCKRTIHRMVKRPWMIGSLLDKNYQNLYLFYFGWDMQVQTVCRGSQGTIFLRNNIRLMNWGLLEIQIWISAITICQGGNERWSLC